MASINPNLDSASARSYLWNSSPRLHTYPAGKLKPAIFALISSVIFLSPFPSYCAVIVTMGLRSFLSIAFGPLLLLKSATLPSTTPSFSISLNSRFFNWSRRWRSSSLSCRFMSISLSSTLNLLTALLPSEPEIPRAILCEVSPYFLTFSLSMATIISSLPFSRLVSTSLRSGIVASLSLISSASLVRVCILRPFSSILTSLPSCPRLNILLYLTPGMTGNKCRISADKVDTDLFASSCFTKYIAREPPLLSKLLEIVSISNSSFLSWSIPSNLSKSIFVSSRL